MAETLIPAVEELRTQYLRFRDDPEFKAEVCLRTGTLRRASQPDLPRKKLVGSTAAAQIYLKREDLNHHRVRTRSTMRSGQALTGPRRMGKKRVIAETGAGMHGVATATVAARYGHGMCGLHGRGRHSASSPNVYRMKLLGSYRGAGYEWFEDTQGMRATKRYATGSPTSRAPFIFSARRRGRIPILDGGAIFKCVIGNEARVRCRK